MPSGDPGVGSAGGGQEARRLMTICNACRYCEGLCAVFPAMERLSVFEDTDLRYPANVCHDCRACFYACQFAPPHEFGVNVPRAFAELRRETYARHARPAVVGRAYARNGLVVALTVT
ncbi:MAG: tricarballylate utilization protein TcuB, partial [Longimicrobiales bacterium]